MTLVKLNAKPDPNHMSHAQRKHFGYLCTLNEKGELLADIPEELIPGELAVGRITLIPE